MACLRKLTCLFQSKLQIYQAARTITTKVTFESLPKFTPIILNNNPWIWKKNDTIKLPIKNQIQFDLPNGLRWTPPLEEPKENITLELPTTVNNNTPKHAERLIVIRRKKMKRHKLKKLRKRMKYEWAKIRQRRELKKEKLFQAGLIKQCKEAEAFSAEQYVEERIKLFNQAKMISQSQIQSSAKK